MTNADTDRCVAAGASASQPAQPWGELSLQQLRAGMQQFAAERDWDQYHTPRNILLALVGETGELSECFQWKGEVQRGLPSFTPAEREHVGQELSDVLLYLVRLADVCGIDLAAAVGAKMQHNAAKYPAELCRGSSGKYTRYTSSEQQQQQQQRGDGEQQRQASQ